MALEMAFTPTPNTMGTGQQQANVTDTPGEIQRVHFTNTADSSSKAEELESLCKRVQQLRSLHTTSIERLEKERKTAKLEAGAQNQEDQAASEAITARESTSERSKGLSQSARSVEVALENMGRGVEVADARSLQRRLEVAKMGNELSRQELSEVKKKLAKTLDMARDGGKLGSPIAARHEKAEAWRSRMSRFLSCPRAASTPRQEAEARFEARLVAFIAASNTTSPERAASIFREQRKSQLKRAREGFGSLSLPDKRVEDARLPVWTLVVVAIAAGAAASLVTARVVAPPPGFGSLGRMMKEEAGFDNSSKTYHGLGDLPPSTAGSTRLSDASSEATGDEEHGAHSSGPNHENDGDGGGHPDEEPMKHGGNPGETVMDDETCRRGIGHGDSYNIFNLMCVEAEEMNATESDATEAAVDGTGRMEDTAPHVLDSEPGLKVVNEGWLVKRIHGAKDLLLLLVFGVATRMYWQRGSG
ncbi:unnamed protein product [Ectocarpus fasciculatus]